MASSWTEYLCLAKLPDGRYRLFMGRYTALAERMEYYNEETEDYDLPDEIDGQKVFGLEDDYVVGGELDYANQSEAVTFSDPDDPAVAQWLAESEWSAAAKKAGWKLKLQELED